MNSATERKLVIPPLFIWTKGILDGAEQHKNREIP
jgi:hypothetical protein